MSDLNGFIQRLKTSQTKMPSIILAELKATGLRGEALAKQYATERMKNRSGYLRRSIESNAQATDGGAEMRLRAGAGANDVKYAATQEYGATIVAKKKFLAIPVGPALTASGVARYTSPRNVAGLRFVPIHGGATGLLVRDVAAGKRRGARSEIWFRLVRSVTIKGKHYLHDAFEKARAELPDRLHRRVLAIMEGGNGQ